MSCACGEPAEEICGACGRQNLECPSCGGGISADPAAVVAACPYCDATLQHVDLDGQPPFFPVAVPAREAGTRLVRFCLNRFGIPGDFEAHCALDAPRLVFVPIRVFAVTARLSESVFETDTCAVVGTDGLWYADALSEYGFAMQVRQYMAPSQHGGAVLEETCTDAAAVARAQAFGHTLAARERKRFAKVGAGAEISVELEGRAFYPLYELSYRYRGRPYRAVVDAANGVVCAADHPVATRSRALILGSGGAMMASSVLIAAAYLATLLVVEGAAIAGAVGGALVTLAVGAVASARILWAGIRSHQSSEETGARASDLDVAVGRGGTRIPVEDRLRLTAGSP